MRRHSVLALILASLLVLAAGCGEDRGFAPPSTTNDPGPSGTMLVPQSVAQEILAATGWVPESAAEPQAKASPVFAALVSVERTPLVDDVVHYKFLLRWGGGPYDMLGLHRVVRETASQHPLRTADAIFLLHGDWKDFEGCFVPGLHSASTPLAFGFAVFLAQSDVDVWGIDQPWTLVPEETGTFDFMADWGMSRHVDWTTATVEVARLVRSLTGNGCTKIMVAGYSGGSALGFALINQDAGLPPPRRMVSAYVGIEQGVRTDDAAFAQAMCDMASPYQAMIEAGQAQDYVILPYFGIPARESPDGPSDLIPGLTNLQAALTLGTMSVVPGFPTHFLAGVFPDESGVPSDLLYTDADRWIDFLCYAPPYEAAAFERDEYLWCCSSEDVPWDDNFARVRIPVLYLSVGGGLGRYATHTLDLLGSTDKEALMVSLIPDPALDFGHIDTFLAGDAPSLVWQPILEWVREHREVRRGQAHGREDT